MATAKKTTAPEEPYYEDSLERAAYLVAHGVKPLSGKWIDSKGIAVFRFAYKQTQLLGKLLMAYKTSKENVALTAFLNLYRLRGQYVKQSRSFLPIEPDAADLTRYLIPFTPTYGD
jgi:hypothetical protein